MKRTLPKRLFRWRFILLFAVLVLAALIPALPLFHQASLHPAHAAGTPTIALSASIVRPGQQVTATAQGFAAYDTVWLDLDNLNYLSFGPIPCDGNGNCSSIVTMPGESVTQGQHTVVATGSNGGLVAQTTVAYIPRITLSIGGYGFKGAPGTFIELSGNGFNPNEAVQFYWGSTGAGGTLLGSKTSTSYGDLFLNFNVPLNTTPGRYLVIAARSQTHPATVSAGFVILPPKVFSAPSVRFGQSDYVSVQGFQANEQVTVKWDANGGQTLGTFSVDNLGNGGSGVATPAAPLGIYTLTVTGNSSGLQASHPISVGPGLTLGPTSNALPGAVITLLGGSFTPNEAVNIQMVGFPHVTTSGTTDASGSFSLPLTLPISYNPAKSPFTIEASNVAGTEHARLSFTFVSPAVFTDNYSLSYGQPVTVSGWGFAPGETLMLFWNYQQPGQVRAATATVASDGSYSMTLDAPSDPALGTVPIAIVGMLSKLKATTSIQEGAAIVLTPASGHPGASVEVAGGGFAGNEVVTVSFNKTTIASVNTTATGAFRTHIVVPPLSGPGNATVQAIGGTSRISIQAIFAYIPALSMTPTTGPAGTILTLTGLHFSGSANITLYWLDPSSGSRTYLNTIQTAADGSFSTMVTAPPGLVGGSTYDLQAVDSQTSLVAQLPFVAQASCVQCLTLSPNIAIPGSTISVQGTGFTSGETIILYFQQPGQDTVRTRAAADGTFTTSLTVPSTYKQGVSYYVFAQSTNKIVLASAQFLFVQPRLWSPYSPYLYANKGEFSGSGFAPGETVNFSWDYGALGKVAAGTAITGGDGSVDVLLTMPSIPSGTQITLDAVGATSHVKAALLVAEQPYVVINPATLNPASQIHLKGGGFGSSEPVTVTLNGTTVAQTTSDQKGFFTYTFTLPGGTVPGLETIQAQGTTSGASVSEYIVIAAFLAITPATGQTGTTITVTGRYFTPSGSDQIYWVDPSTYQATLLANVTASNTGTVHATVTAPTGLTPGNTYEVELDDQAGFFATASFIAQ